MGMMDKEKVLRGWDRCSKCLYPSVFDQQFKDCEYTMGMYCRKDKLISETVALLKEQEERLRKLQKDKDKLCLEVSEWKHKFHDAPPKFVSQGAVDQIRWERDTALSQLEQIGKGLGSKMDDIVSMLKKQEAEWIEYPECLAYDGAYSDSHIVCSACKHVFSIMDNCTEEFDYCPHCGAKMKQEGR